MANDELREFILAIKSATDDELIEMLRGTNRIAEENLKLGASLLRKIVSNEGRVEIGEFLTKDRFHGHDVIGAVDPALILMEPHTIAELTFVYANKITGSDLYCLWNDCGKRDYTQYMLNIWALMSGVYSKQEIEDNFRVIHIDFDNISEEDKKWFNSQPRTVIRPFVYGEDIINIRNYVKDIHNFDPTDEAFKEFVGANRSLQLFVNFLHQTGLRHQGFKFTDKRNELLISMVMPELQAHPYYDYIKEWKQPSNANKETFVIDTNQIAQLAINRPKSKFYNELDKNDLCKSLHFLKYAKKHFLPGLTVIRSMPLENIENFYINNNDKRYGEIIKLGEFNDLHSQVGIFKLGFLLGLFNKSENESTIASDYIKQFVIGKVPTDDVHKLYGGFDISEGFKKEFAEFFMLHHSGNPHCFEDSQGTDKTAQIYHYIYDILKFRPEKKIKTTTNRERLMPEDAISAISSGSIQFGLPPEFDPYVEVLSQYVGEKKEILWIIHKLEEAREIPEERISIPYVEDDANEPYKFRVLKKGDPEVGICGKKTNCCFEYQGASQSSLEHALVSPDSSVVVFESERDYVQGWIWYDEEKGVLVIDNLEGRCGYVKNQFLINAIIRFADKSMTQLNKKGKHCVSVNLGKRYIRYDLAEALRNAEENGIIKTADNPSIEYAKKHKLYTDAMEQYIISNKQLMKMRETQTEQMQK